MTKQRPAVSIVVPARDAARTLAETLDSVRDQTFTDFEVVLIDDGSTDRTLAVLSEVGDARFHGYRYPHGGLAAARNRGLSRALGEFVTFLDADDIWTPDKLEAQVGLLRADPAAGAAYSWTAFLDEDGSYLFAKERCYADGDVGAALRRGFFIASGSNVMFRRECVDRLSPFDPAFDPCSDWEYMIRFADRWPVRVIPRCQVLYRISTTSMTSRVEAVERASRKLWGSMYPEGAPRGPARDCLAGMLQYECFLILCRAPERSCRRPAGRKLWRSIATHPPALLGLKTLKLLAAWLLLSMVPATRLRATLRALLRLQGRWAIARRPELRVDAILQRLA